MSPLSEEDLHRLDDRYVTKVECEEKNDKIQAAIASMDKNMSVMVAKQEQTNKLMSKLIWTVIGAIISAVASGTVGLLLGRLH